MTNPDLVLFQTQRLTDNANGGGQLTSTIIPDNQPNNLFGPISRINRADGNVSLRKAIVKALSADTKTYFGAHIIIASPPTNPDVSAVMFSTDSWTDVHSDALEFLESYLVQGPQTRLWAYGNQVIGQRSIIGYQPPADPLPSIGDTYVITNQSVTPNVSQFVRISSISNTIQTFIDSAGTFNLNIVTMGITEPLTANYPGAEAQRFSTPTPPTIMCITNVADAATYYGVETLSADVSSGAETATLTSIFAQLVPSSQGESPITAAQPVGAFSYVASGAPISGSYTGTSAGGTYVGRGIMPGSLTFGGHADDGKGTIPFYGYAVDYAAGHIASTTNGFVSLTFTPAVQISQSGYFQQQPVTEGTRGYLWIQTCNPVPAPGSTTVSYRALGRWYTLQDDGSGTLVGAVGAGTGTVDFATGIIVLTTGALPDIDSNVVFSWGQAAQYDIRTGDVTIQVPAVSIQLSHPAQSGTVSITWLDGVTTRTVTDNGSGALTGYGTGSIIYSTGLISLHPTTLPNVATGINVAYTSNAISNDSFTPSKSGSDISITLSNAPIAAKSVNISYSVPLPTNWPDALLGGANAILQTIHDDGSGNLIGLYGSVAGSVNYTTGVVTFDPDVLGYGIQIPNYESLPVQVWDSGTHAWVISTQSVLTNWLPNIVTAPFVNGSTVTATSIAASASNVSETESFPTPAIKVDLTPTTNQAVVDSGVRFGFANDVYVDRAGILYRSVSTTTNSGTAAGTIDYTSGLTTITDWNGGSASTVSITALLCEYGISPVGVLCSRVPGQSVRPSSFQIQANRASDNALISATADSDGNWTTSDMTGHIDYETGFYTVSFGQLVLDSSLSGPDKAEPWYNSGNVDGTGHIWRPNEALPGSITYSCVVETILPLNAGVLGLDPVRLPSDGRVPIISGGSTLVFRNPLTYTFTGTKVAGDTITLPRGGLESVVLYDSDGVQVDISLYTADLTVGSVTIANPADLSPYTQPFVATHTQGELVLCTDAEITGQISFSPALTNAYPHTSSYVSSALIADNSGNLQADYDTKFQQTTWNFAPATLWEDIVQGSSPTAVYDDVDFPIQVLDRDTITQRVALIFTSSTGGNIAFEELGVIGTFTTSADVAPNNPATSNPFFVMDHRGFGTGWASGNAIRFNLRGAGFPVWFARSVQVGAGASLDDSFATELRWDE